MSEANVELVTTIYERIRRREELADLVADDLEYVNPPYAVEGGVRRGRDSLLGVMDIYEDFSFEVDRYVDGPDQVVAIGTASGTSPSGLSATWRMGHVWTIAGGKSIRFAWFNDPADALKLAGLDDD
jgi:ketosteroid isomerase-like protein